MASDFWMSITKTTDDYSTTYMYALATIARHRFKQHFFCDVNKRRLFLLLPFHFVFKETTWISKTKIDGVNRFVDEKFLRKHNPLLHQPTNQIPSFFHHWYQTENERKSSINHTKLKIKLKASRVKIFNKIFTSRRIHQRSEFCERWKGSWTKQSNSSVPNNCIIKKKSFMCVTFLLWLVILMNTRAVKVCD